MNLSEYLENPCGLLSIPYWKAQKIFTPDNMRIVHNSIFSQNLLTEYDDTEYFRLKHDLKNINKPELSPDFTIHTITEKQYPDLTELINCTYEHLGIKVDIKQINEWTNTEVYEPDLWIALFEKDRMAGAVIADYDKTAGEAIIEWLQILPEYRGMGLASAVLNECLGRMQGKADFVTVSGQVNNMTKPERVYRKCGFTGNDIWHILIKK